MKCRFRKFDPGYRKKDRFIPIQFLYDCVQGRHLMGADGAVAPPPPKEKEKKKKERKEKKEKKRKKEEKRKKGTINNV